MVVVDVVLETCDAVGFTAWPIVGVSGDHLLVVSGEMSLAEVGTALAVILSYNGISVDSVGDLTADRLEEHLAETGGLVAPGGLRFRDTATSVQVAPGCCFGLESWRDWWDVVQGQDLWLGHDPTPRLEHADQIVRLWQGDEDDAQPIEIPLNELANLLSTAQHRLSGFLNLVRQWTISNASDVTNSLVAALDEHLKINR